MPVVHTGRIEIIEHRPETRLVERLEAPSGPQVGRGLQGAVQPFGGGLRNLPGVKRVGEEFQLDSRTIAVVPVPYGEMPRLGLAKMNLQKLPSLGPAFTNPLHECDARLRQSQRRMLAALRYLIRHLPPHGGAKNLRGLRLPPRVRAE